MEELKVMFYLKKNEERADGTVPILGRIRIGKSMVQFSTKVYVIPSLWDVKSGRAVGKSKSAAATNKELDRITLDIHSAYKDLLAKKETVSALEVKNAFQGVSSEQETIVSFYVKCNERFYEKVGTNRKMETYKRYGVALNHLKDFLRQKYHVKDMPFQALTPSFVSSFDLYLRADLKMALGTVNNIIGRLRSVIKSALNDGLLRKDPFNGYTFDYPQIVPKFLSEKELEQIMNTPLPKPNLNLVRDVFLSEKELEQMMNTPLPKPNLNLVRDVFLFSAFTGIAFSDIRNLTRKNLSKAEDGIWWIHSARRKTGTPFHIPLLDLPLELIDKYRGIAPNGRLFPMLSCSKTNINLKKIASICGIERRVTFHQARHTYASVITLSQGVPLDTVRELMGHRDWRATQIYAHLTNDKVSEDMGRLQESIGNKFELTDNERAEVVISIPQIKRTKRMKQ